MDPNEPPSKQEFDIVRMRYYEGLCNQEIADKLGLRLHQVKYRVKKPNVKKYVREIVLPHIRQQRIAELKAKLANPIQAFAEQLVADKDAKTYFWLGPGNKIYYSDNRRQFRYLKWVGRIFGITGDQKNFARDFKKAVIRNARRLQEELERLKREDEAQSQK